MKSKRLISELRPRADQTLMSYVRAVQYDACLTRQAMDQLIAGHAIANDRLAERRLFDFQSWSQWMNADAEELMAMSERSVFDVDGFDTSGGPLAHRASWCSEIGYGNHCPCCLEESSHRQRSWLRPDAFICQRHGTLLVGHCCGCGARLSDLAWRTANCECPKCGTHLSLGPNVAAPERVRKFSERVRGRYAQVRQMRPGLERHRAVAEFDACWRAARWMVYFPELMTGLGRFVDVGEFEVGSSIGSIALRSAQAAMIAYAIPDFWPRFNERVWLSPTNWRERDTMVLHALEELCDTTGVGIFSRRHVGEQGLLSFGSNLLKAA